MKCIGNDFDLSTSIVSVVAIKQKLGRQAYRFYVFFILLFYIVQFTKYYDKLSVDTQNIRLIL